MWNKFICRGILFARYLRPLKILFFVYSSPWVSKYPLLAFSWSLIFILIISKAITTWGARWNNRRRKLVCYSDVNKLFVSISSGHFPRFALILASGQHRASPALCWPELYFGMNSPTWAGYILMVDFFLLGQVSRRNSQGSDGNHEWNMILNTSRLEISRFGFDDWHFFLRDPFASSAMWLWKQAMKAKRVIYKILEFKCAGKNERKNKNIESMGRLR